MDNARFLQTLCELSLEDGRAHIQAHLTELADHNATGKLLADEALRQLYIAPFVSLKLSELLIFFGEHTEHTFSHALGLKAKGDALERFGSYQTAMECLEEAGKKFLSIGDKVDWARSRISWVTACAWLGRTEEALQEADAARDVFLSCGERYWACIIDHNTAVICSQTGKYQKALDLYERMLAIYPTLTGQSEASIQLAIAMVEVNQARNLAWLGQFEQAYALLWRAQASFIQREQTDQLLNVEFNLAELDYAQGYYGSALRRYYQLRDGLLQVDFDAPEALASIMLRMSTCLVKLNRAEEAYRLAEEAVAVYRRLGTSLLLGDALREYASILLASNRRGEALAALEQARTFFTQAGFEHHASAAQLQQAELLLRMRAYDTAYDQARAVNVYFEAQGLISRTVGANLVMAESLIERRQAKGEQLSADDHDLQEAALLCRRAGSLTDQYHLLEQGYKSQYLSGRLASVRGDLKKAAESYNAAIDQIEYILDDLVYDLSPSFLHTTWTVYEDMIALCLRQGQHESAFSYLERARSMALRQYMNRSRNVDMSGKQQDSVAMLQIQSELGRWQEKYHQYSAQLAAIDSSISPAIDRNVLQAELQRCETRLSELFERLYLYESGMQTVPRVRNAKSSQEGEEINVAQLRQRLLPGQLLLAYFLSKESLVIFAITTDSMIVHENSAGVEALERLLPPFYAHLETRGWTDPQKPPQLPIRRLLNKLYQLLIAPVAAMLPPPSGSLTIVPYGSLHKLPFHALYDGAHFLIEDFQVNYLPASFFLHLETQGKAQPATATALKAPLILGYSDHGQVQCILDEAKALATALGGRCYLEDDATIARLMEEAPGSPIIHLATHGHSRLDAPNFSYIRLADGQLNAIDAFNLNLEGCELVTLSGCETGMSLSGGGDEQLGLGRAFLAAGAPSLVMSLWPVEDNATNELMQAFYQHLLDGDTKVQALRAAQCRLLRSASPAYAHPYFWAAFRLVGEVGSLQYNNAYAYAPALKNQPLKK